MALAGTSRAPQRISRAFADGKSAQTAGATQLFRPQCVFNSKRLGGAILADEGASVRDAALNLTLLCLSHSRTWDSWKEPNGVPVQVFDMVQRAAVDARDQERDVRIHERWLQSKVQIEHDHLGQLAL